MWDGNYNMKGLFNLTKLPGPLHIIIVDLFFGNQIFDLSAYTM